MRSYMRSLWSCVLYRGNILVSSSPVHHLIFLLMISLIDARSGKGARKTVGGSSGMLGWFVSFSLTICPHNPDMSSYCF
jgi:hypothetical protein